MSRKSLILCLSALAVLILGVGVAVAVLYSGVEGSGRSDVTKVQDQTRYSLLSAVPSDAVLVSCFSKAGVLDSRMAVSLHYSGKLVPLYLYDAGRAAEEQRPDVAEAVARLKEKGLTVEYVPDFSGRALILASASETVVRSSLRHMDKGMSIADAPGFVEATESVSGSDVIFVSNVHASYLIPEALTRKYSSCSSFVSRIADWTAFDVSMSDMHFSLTGGVVYDSDPSEYMTVLEKSSPAHSSLSEILPSYTVSASSIPMSDIDGYINAYRNFLDSRQAMQKNAALQKTLAGKAGISPVEFMKTVDVREVAVASFMAGGKLEKVNLIRTGVQMPDILFKGLDVESGKKYIPAIHSWPYQSFVSSVFGNLFKLEDESCFTYIDGWVVSGSMKAVEEYVSGRALDYTLRQYMADASQGDLLSRGKAAFISYFSFSENEEFLKDVFRPAFMNLVSPVYEGAEYSPAVFSVSHGKSGPVLSAEVLKLTLQKSKAPSFERDTVVTVPEGPFQVKNSGTGKMNSFYQNSHLSLCLRQDGKDLWGVPFKEPLCGTAHNVDYYANGKLQILFGAGSRIYLIDRLGRYVSGFPVDLKKPILLGPDVYDFNGTRKYNIMVLHKDNTIEMYNLKGQRPASWKTIAPSETVKRLPERIVVGGSSFWIVRTSIQTLIYPLYGGEPLTTFAGDQMICPDSEIKVLSATEVQVKCYDGKNRTVALK